MLLGSDETGAGHWDKVAGTLASLQVYEWAVIAVILVLHRHRRAPEDYPILLLLAVVFWTAPLVATMEMNAQSRQWGLLLSAVVGAIAVVELHVVQRALRINVEPATMAGASLTVMLLALAQPMLKIEPAAVHANEVLLYALWWVLAGLLALSGWVMPRPRGTRAPAFRDTAILLLLTMAGAAAHVVAMNRAFYGHMRPFYAAPLLFAFAVLIFRRYRPQQGRPNGMIVFALGLPALALYWARARFAPQFPLEALPRPLRDPLLVVSVLAAGTWLYGFLRWRSPALVHASAVALAIFAVRFWSIPTDLDSPLWSRGRQALLLYAITIYLLMFAWQRRSWAPVVTALVTHWAAFSLLVVDVYAWGAMASALLAGWSALLGIHIGLPRPALVVALAPVLLLIVASAWFHRDPRLALYVEIHAVAMPVALALWGWLQPVTRYYVLAAIAAGLEGTPALAVALRDSRSARALTVIAGGFVLLAAGAVLSWHKQRFVARPEVEPPAPADLPGDI
jgi:heme/copper-type cytochrome/quinol oxidase subunit 4